MSADANTDQLLMCPPPPPEPVAAALLAARPGGPGELVLRVFADGRLLVLALDLSAGDRLQLGDALAAVPARGTIRVSRADTIRTLFPPD